MVNITGLYDPLTTKQTGLVYPRMETLGDDTNVEVSVHWCGPLATRQAGLIRGLSFYLLPCMIY